MSELFDNKGPVYHLHGYAIFENQDGTFEYIAWEDKSGKLRWIRGDANVLEDVLVLRSITSEDEETSMETLLELKYELGQLSSWDKTKYYGIVIGNNVAARMMYSETGELVQKTAEDYETIKEMLSRYSVELY
jgi:hypothetical protein